MAITLDAAKEMGRSLGMSDTDVEGFKAQFDACDEDGGGTISNDELKTVLLKCGVKVSNVEVERYIKEFDTDGDGVLDFGEFLSMMHKFNQGPSELDTRKAMFEVREGHSVGRGAVRPPPWLARLLTRTHTQTRTSSAPLPPPPLLPVPQSLDDNFDGLVSWTDLRDAWKQAAAASASVQVPPEGEIRQLFANADLDRDGFLNETEFYGLCEVIYPGKE
jgi:Ca2+-binding EF-hand superfamily protein